MKNILKTLVVFAATALVLNSCGEADPILYEGPTFVSFTGGTSGSYFVQEDNATFPVQVGLPAPADADLSVSIEVIFATGTAGTQFDLPSSITIAKGDVVADIEVQGYFSELVGRKDTLTFQLSGSDVASFDTAYTIIMQQYCEFDIANFTGAYSCDEEGYGVYGANFTEDTEMANSILNDNFWDYPAAGQTLRYVFSANTDQEIIVPDQPFTFGDGYEGSVSGSGTYNGCSGAMSVDYLVKYGGDTYATHHEFTPGAPGKKSVLIKRGE